MYNEGQDQVVNKGKLFYIASCILSFCEGFSVTVLSIQIILTMLKGMPSQEELQYKIYAINTPVGCLVLE